MVSASKRSPTPPNDNNKSHALPRWVLFGILPLLIAALAAWCGFGNTTTQLPKTLEPVEGVAQCNYELIRAFSAWVEAENSVGGPDQPPLVYTLGAGSLLGAMRSDPPGLLQWEHDVDIYAPAFEAENTTPHPAIDSMPKLIVRPPPWPAGGPDREPFGVPVRWEGFVPLGEPLVWHAVVAGSRRA